MKAASEMVREVFAQVLEKQVFMFVEELAPEAFPPDESEWVEARMAFTGPFNGRLSLALPKGAEMEMAANFLGKDVDDPEVAGCAEDALKEILNVVCGHLLTTLAGEEPVFDLSIPKVFPLSQQECEAIAANPEVHGFDMEGRPVLLRFECSEGNG